MDQRQLAASTQIGSREIALTALPRGIVVREPLGLVTSELVDGQVVHTARWPERGLFECRATKTPAGDLLLMFPDGGHYCHQQAKNNDLLAYRSRDGGRTWQGPTIAFDIDYSQHGFIPLIPRGSKRLYAFGTQPIPATWTNAHGQAENAPIGYRYSDDDGHHWSEVRLIRPSNDPAFTGMSVMRMCETDAGTWLIGAHVADWSYKPLITRQYILRSTDQGATWTLLPGGRHGGWHCPGFGRMDEGRPIHLGGGNVLLMARTPAGHLWELRSNDDGQTWSEPKPTTLVHPDAPPMVFMLSDGRTLAAFHHNRHHDKNYRGLDAGNIPQMQDRSELWVATSTDDGQTWSAPRFVAANALAPSFANSFRNYNCSYCDVVLDEGWVHLFMPHRWERVVHLKLRETDLARLPLQHSMELGTEAR